MLCPVARRGGRGGPDDVVATLDIDVCVPVRFGSGGGMSLSGVLLRSSD